MNKIWPFSQRAGLQNKRFTIEEIIKIVATRCQILRLKCTNLFVGWGSAPDPAGGAYSAPPDSIAKGEGREGRIRKGREERGSGGRGGEGWGGRGQGRPPS